MASRKRNGLMDCGHGAVSVGFASKDSELRVRMTVICVSDFGHGAVSLHLFRFPL